MPRLSPPRPLAPSPPRPRATARYTARFHDGDERVLRRPAVMPMGPSHFEEGQTLGDFPLTGPDSFASGSAAGEADFNQVLPDSVGN